VELHGGRGVAGDRAGDYVVDAGGAGEILVGAAHATRREAVRQLDRGGDRVEGRVQARPRSEAAGGGREQEFAAAHFGGKRSLRRRPPAVQGLILAFVAVVLRELAHPKIMPISYFQF